ncbi:MAG: hypothetical protein ACU841_12190 [Gammaproteobacteria bacterium]
MPNKIIAKIADFILGLSMAVYIVLEELIWDKIAEPAYSFIHSLKILQKTEQIIVRLDNHVLLALFLALFIQVELMGIVALKLIGTGKVISGTMLYVGKIPVAAFTFWFFRISKAQLMTFGWFKQTYDLLMLLLERIKSSAVHQNILAKLKAVKAWLNIRLAGSRQYIGKLLQTLKRPKASDDTDR